MFIIVVVVVVVVVVVIVVVNVSAHVMCVWFSRGKTFGLHLVAFTVLAKALLRDGAASTLGRFLRKINRVGVT